MDSEGLGQELSDQDRILLVFGYLGPLALVALVATRREFVKWHAKQGLLLTVALVLSYGVLRFVHALIGRWAFFSELFWAAVWMALLGVFVAMLFCIVRGLEGERFKLPMLGDLADRL
jgi:uncharacterized membrane protein